jgi:hypothetical protein
MNLAKQSAPTAMGSCDLDYQNNLKNSRELIIEIAINPASSVIVCHWDLTKPWDKVIPVNAVGPNT